MTTVVYDSDYTPKVTLTKTESGGFTAVLEVEGLEPTRSETSEERFVGITSLDPPTVTVRAKATPYKTHLVLIAACQRAVAAAATSTLGNNGGPGGLLMTHFRVALGVRSALRLLEEDI